MKTLAAVWSSHCIRSGAQALGLFTQLVQNVHRFDEQVMMSKLKTLKPRLQKLPPRLKAPREIRDTRYSPDATVRGWYHSARWQKLRQEVLIRDLYTCQQTGVILTIGRTEPNAAVVHHKLPHKGDERLFWDINNLEAVSKEWHDSEAQREERRA